MKRAILLAFVSTPALASTSYTQDARDLSAAALCGATNVTCQQSYTSGAKDGTAAEIGDGTQLKQPPDSWVAVPHVVPVPPHP